MSTLLLVLIFLLLLLMTSLILVNEMINVTYALAVIIDVFADLVNYTTDVNGAFTADIDTLDAIFDVFTVVIDAMAVVTDVFTVGT